MEAFTTLDAVAIPIDQPNLDTDQIIPARLLGKPREMQVSALFHDLRYAPDKSPRPDFVTNRPAFAGARIVVAERNFACGSSRENAVTVMVDNGLRAFIAPSFGDIFFNNCFQNGMLPIRLSEEDVDELFRRARAAEAGNTPYRLHVDLRAGTVSDDAGFSRSFTVDPFRKRCLLEGLDDIGLSLQHVDKIAAWEAAHATPAGE
jgi:3-isopropylmalate/(R)-2-methylmalate dehydratase small subunit